MGDFTYAGNADMHYMYGCANSNGRAAKVSPDDRQIRIFHRQLSFHVARYDVGRRTAVCSPNLEESILNIVADRPVSSTRGVVHPVRVSRQTICKVSYIKCQTQYPISTLKGNPLHPFHFQ
ncbi:hypothetical protein TNCV_2727341 [Trichonephila clavipes]|nr:hypothetical protein TNCV_2727341 [Trichonephila clavipes]